MGGTTNNVLHLLVGPAVELVYMVYSQAKENREQHCRSLLTQGNWIMPCLTR